MIPGEVESVGCKGITDDSSIISWTVNLEVLLSEPLHTMSPVIRTNVRSDEINIYTSVDMCWTWNCHGSCLWRPVAVWQGSLEAWLCSFEEQRMYEVFNWYLLNWKPSWKLFMTLGLFWHSFLWSYAVLIWRK